MALAGEIEEAAALVCERLSTVTAAGRTLTVIPSSRFSDDPGRALYGSLLLSRGGVSGSARRAARRQPVVWELAIPLGDSFDVGHVGAAGAGESRVSDSQTIAADLSSMDPDHSLMGMLHRPFESGAAEPDFVLASGRRFWPRITEVLTQERTQADHKVEAVVVAFVACML